MDGSADLCACGNRHAQGDGGRAVSLIDEALSANAMRGFVYDVHTGRLSEVLPDAETVAS